MLRADRLQTLLIVVAVLLCINSIISCSEDGAKTQSSSETQIKPSDVVVAAYMAANEEKYAEAEKYLSSDAKAAIQEATELAGGIKDVWDRRTHNATIVGIEIDRQDVEGERATIAILIHFKDGSSSNQHESLVKEGGQWKLTL
jgi:hypothetical protein